MPGRSDHAGRDVPEVDAHGHALHDLGVVAARVVGRQQREARAGRGREALDLAVRRHAGERVDLDVRGLAGAHLAELRLLEVAGDPHIAGWGRAARCPGPAAPSARRRWSSSTPRRPAARGSWCTRDRARRCCARPGRRDTWACAVRARAFAWLMSASMSLDLRHARVRLLHSALRLRGRRRERGEPRALPARAWRRRCRDRPAPGRARPARASRSAPGSRRARGRSSSSARWSGPR